jgi:uncharacterized protein YndB with AHSA1/START domain
MSQRFVSVSRYIPAPPSVIFDLLANPYEHHRLDGSGTVHLPRGNAPRRLFLGARFSMDMKMGASYVTANRVVAFEENRVIAWCHWARFVWRYELTPQGDGTLVTESFDFRKPWGLPLTLLDWAGKTTQSITATLERLEELVS